MFSEGELDEKSNVHFLHIPFSDKPVKVYSLNVIISVGYRVKSIRGTQFRIWATNVLREYLLRGYTVNTRLNQLEDKVDRRLAKHDDRLATLEQKVVLSVPFACAQLHQHTVSRSLSVYFRQ